MGGRPGKCLYDNLVTAIAEHDGHSLICRLNAYTAPSLLICDELGYPSLDQQTLNLFYQVISTCHAELRSTVITN
jgi:DNA replication protein DnaC